MLGTDYASSNELIEYMTKPANKTDVALKIFDTAEAIVFPGYINAAVE